MVMLMLKIMLNGLGNSPGRFSGFCVMTDHLSSKSVRFSLENEQYNALAEYFGENERPATLLVKKAMEEFISLIT